MQTIIKIKQETKKAVQNYFISKKKKKIKFKALTLKSR